MDIEIVIGVGSCIGLFAPGKSDSVNLSRLEATLSPGVHRTDHCPSDLSESGVNTPRAGASAKTLS